MDYFSLSNKFAWTNFRESVAIYNYKVIVSESWRQIIDLYFFWVNLTIFIAEDESKFLLAFMCRVNYVSPLR